MLRYALVFFIIAVAVTTRVVGRASALFGVLAAPRATLAAKWQRRQ